MRRLGISIYPKTDSFKQDEIYIRKAASLGYKRVFTCFLSISLEGKELYDLITKYSKLIHELGMVLSVDTNPSTFEKLNISVDNPVEFKEMGIDIVRLDGAFDVDTTINFINNDIGLIVELNASSLLPVERFKEVNKDQLLTCHNFYPQKYTGLDLDIFNTFTNPIKKCGVSVAAFVSSQVENTFGPWPVFDGLPTLEECRYLSIDEQFRYLVSLGIDDIFFGNAYASDEELETLAKLNDEVVCLKVKEVCCCDDIVYNNIHSYRHDGNSIIIRSSVTRGKEVEVFNTYETLYPGDVVLVNKNMKYYQGELLIVLKEIKNDGTRSVIARLSDTELMIAKNLKQSDKFKIIR